VKRLEGKVAIITGAAQGLGLVTSKLFVREGAKVVATDIQAEKVASEIAAIGSKDIIAVTHDVRIEESWRQVVDKTISTFGHLEVLVNNAAINLQKNVITATFAEFKDAIDTNLSGCFLGINLCYPVVTKGAYSSIVNISSVGGLVGGPLTGDDAGYNASKGGLRLLTKHAAHVLAHDKIRVNSVHPGGIMTAMRDIVLEKHPAIEEVNRLWYSPLPPHGAYPEDVANGILFLASDESKAMTGSELVIDNGFSSN
jgi:3alpha(or 20beta)-hydroxysteroid dehydrogenase